MPLRTIMRRLVRKWSTPVSSNDAPQLFQLPILPSNGGGYTTPDFKSTIAPLAQFDPHPQTANRNRPAKFGSSFEASVSLVLNMRFAGVSNFTNAYGDLDFSATG